jgi:hypothetical protein
MSSPALFEYCTNEAGPDVLTRLGFTQMGQAVLIVFSFVSNDMFIGLDQPQPTDSSWWANQGNLPRPHNCGLFRQCSTKACTFLVPGAQTVTYPDGYKYGLPFSAVPSNLYF